MSRYILILLLTTSFSLKTKTKVPYTVAEDGSYFAGSYKNGQPDGGTWYSKDGKEIEKK